MSVSVADATTLLENVLFESASLAATNAPGWVSQSSTNASESTVSGLAAAMAASPEAGIVQQVVRYYEGALGRAPAGFEILYYVNIVEAGLTASQISAGATSVPQTAWNQVASDFANSPEFSFATAGTNVVTLLYQNILGRTPGPAELAFYQAQIAAGYPDTILIQEFTNSPEFQASVDGNVSSALASFGTAAVAGSGLPLLPVKLPGQDVSVALGSSPVTVAGTSVVTTVTVTGLPAAAAQAAQTAATGVIGVSGVTAATGVQPVVAVTAVTPQTTQSAANAVTDGSVTITDQAYSAAGTGSITSVTLVNSGAGSVIYDSALTSLSLTGTTGTLAITNNIAAASAAHDSVLALALDGLSAAQNAITDSNNEIATLMVTTVAADSTLSAFVDSHLTSLTVSGSNKLTLSSINSTLTSLAVTGSASFSDGATLHGTGLAAAGGGLTITDTATGSFTAVLDATTQTFTGSTGADRISVSDLVDATKTITAGSATANAIIFEGGSYALTSASSGKFINFQTIGVAGSVTGSIDVSTIDPTATALELTGANSGVTFTKVAAGTAITIDPSAGATATIDYADSTGAQDSATVTLSGAVAGLTLQDAASVGIGTVTIANSLAGGETSVSAAHVLASLTDNGLATLNVSGSAGLTIATLNESVTPATKLTLNDTTANGYGMTIGALTDNALTSLAFTGTGLSTIAALNDSAAALSITNSSTTLDYLGTLNANSLTSLTLANNVSLGQASTPLTSIGLQDAATTGVTVAGGKDNAHVTIDLTSGAAVGQTDSIALGNGNNVVVDASTAGTVAIVLGTGANLVELGSASLDSTAIFTVTLSARASSSVNAIVVGAAGTNYASAPNTTITGASLGDIIVFGNDTISSAATLTAASLTGVASVASAIATLEAAATTAHQVVYGVYGGNSYLVETASGSLGGIDTTVVKIAGSQTLTAGIGNVTIGSTLSTLSVGTLPGNGFSIPAGTATNLTLKSGSNLIDMVGPSTNVTDNFTSLSGSTALTILDQATSGTDTIVLSGSGGANMSDVSSLIVNDTSSANAGAIIAPFTANSLTSVTYNNSAANGSIITQAALTSSSLNSINFTGGVAGQATNTTFLTATLTTTAGVTINDTNIGTGATTMGLTLTGGANALTVSMTGPGTLATGALADNNLTSITIAGSGLGAVNIGTLADSSAAGFTVTDSSTSSGGAVIALAGLSAATSLTINDNAATGALTDNSAYADASLTTLSLRNTGAALLTVGNGGITANALSSIGITGSGTGGITVGTLTDTTAGAFAVTDASASTGLVTLPLTGVSAASLITIADSAAGGLGCGNLSDALLTTLTLSNTGSAALTVGSVTANALTNLTIADGAAGTIVLGAISDTVAGAVTWNDTSASTAALGLTIASLANATSVTVNDGAKGAFTVGAFTDNNAASLTFNNTGSALLTASSITDSSAALTLTILGSSSGTDSLAVTDTGAVSFAVADSSGSTGATTIAPTLAGGPASFSATDSASGALTIAAFTDANLTSASLTNTGAATLTAAGITNATSAGAGLFNSLTLAGSGLISASLSAANNASTVTVTDSDTGSVTISALTIGSTIADTGALTLSNANAGSGSLIVSAGTVDVTTLTLDNSSLSGTSIVTLTDGASGPTSVTFTGAGAETLALTDNAGQIILTQGNPNANIALTLTHNGINNEQISLGNGTNSITLADSTPTDLVALSVGSGSNNITLPSGHTAANSLGFSTTLASNGNTTPATADVVHRFLADSGIAQGDTIVLGFGAANILTTADANSGGSGFWTATNGIFSKTGASVLNFIADVQSLTQAGGVAATSGIAGFSDGTNSWIAYNDASGSHVSVIELAGVVMSGIEAAGTTNNFVHIA